jgi:tetratricopeptide (TPR) repeat protein
MHPSEPEAARYLAKVSGSLPLALRIVASKAVMEPNKSLSALAQELEDPVACLELSAALPQRPLRLRGLFADSYDTLSPDLARALRTLGLAFTDEFSSTALASMMEVDPEVARSMLERMADLCVVEQTPLAGKFRIHPLWHAYARTVAKEEETPETQAQVVQRLLRYYLQETAGATRKLWRAWPGLPENEMCCVSDIDDARAGKKWLDGEQTNLYIAVCVALECGEYDIAWRLALLCGSFLSLRRRWLEWIRMLRNGLSAARRANNPVAEVDVLAALGFAYLEIKHFQRAADCFGEALTKGNCGSDEIRSCLLRLGLQASSFGHVSPLTGDQPVVATQRGLRGSGGLVLLGMGYLYRQVRLFGAAESYARMVVKAFKETGCRVGEAVALMELGRVLQADGQLLESISCFESALHIWRDLEESLAQGECLLAMGDWWYAAGQVKEAEAAWVRALPLFGACDDNLAMITHARLRQLQANDPDSPGCAVPKSWVPRQAAEK